MYCRHCGNEIPDDSKFCRFCGKPMQGARAASPNGKGSKMYCSYCGHEVPSDSVFCSHCGRSLNTAASADEATSSNGKRVTDPTAPQLSNPFADFLSHANQATKDIGVGLESVTGSFANQAAVAGKVIGDRAVKLRSDATAALDDINNKLTELDRMLEQSTIEYNDAYTLMSDKGLRLYIERERSSDSIQLVEALVNSIANHPKSFDDDFRTIDTNRMQFHNTAEYADRELQAAREAVTGAGAGLAAGASVAFMAPTAAMWVATTFGTASTGTAISTLSGAAATNAALAWLGGGTLAAGGGGIAAGNALLALAGPIGWGIAGASLLSSIALFANNRQKLNKQKNEEIESVKRNTERVREMDAQIESLLQETVNLREGLTNSYMACLQYFGKDYSAFGPNTKSQLGALVNNTLTLSKLFDKTVG